MKPRTKSPTHRQPWHRAEAGRAPQARRPAAGGHGSLLSADQKAALNMLAKEAFQKLDTLGLIDLPAGSASARLRDWRRAEQLKAVGIASLTECRNSHYRTLRGHFETLCGREDKGYRDFTRTGKVRDKGPATDTHEARETFRKLILDELLAHGRRCDPRSEEFDPAIAARVMEKGLITPAYIVQIAKFQNKGRALADLPADRLEMILYTTRNRIAAREGRGDPAARNKSQRGTRKASKHDFTPDR
jgi:ribosomal protein L32